MNDACWEHTHMGRSSINDFGDISSEVLVVLTRQGHISS